MEFFNPTPKSKRTNERAIDFSQSTLILVSLNPCTNTVFGTNSAYALVPSFTIQPIVSLANVSQLAADLLIHSLALESVGSLSARYHVPCLSPIDYVDRVGSPSSSIPASRPRKGFSTAIEGKLDVSSNGYPASRSSFPNEAYPNSSHAHGFSLPK